MSRDEHDSRAGAEAEGSEDAEMSLRMLFAATVAWFHAADTSEQEGRLNREKGKKSSARSANHLSRCLKEPYKITGQ